MDDSISRRAAIEAIHGAIFDFFDICDDDEESPMTYKDEQLLEINKAISGRVKQLPSAQQERKKGKWIEGKCDQCGEHAPFWPMASTYYRSNFCPNCGADMREKAEKPTQKQVEYAKYLAKRMCQELPTEDTKQAYSEFISRWKPVVKHEDDVMNAPSEWQMQYE